MKISGKINFSLVNYPGKESCVIFTKGCPLTCPYCYNKCLLKENLLDNNEIFKFLEKRKGLLDAVVISGGEPMLQYKDLLPFIIKVKEMGYLIGIHITGLNSDKREFDEIIQLCDWIGLDFKCPKEKYKQLFNLDFNLFKTALNKLIQYDKNFEIRTTYFEQLSKEDYKEMEKFLLENGIKKWVIQNQLSTEGTLKYNFPYNKEDFNINLEIR